MIPSATLYSLGTVAGLQAAREGRTTTWLVSWTAQLVTKSGQIKASSSILFVLLWGKGMSGSVGVDSSDTYPYDDA